MTITRRNVLLGATATAAMLPIAARAQTSEVVIGLTYPFSGANAQIGVDAQKAYETAAEIVNKNYDFDLLLGRSLFILYVNTDTNPLANATVMIEYGNASCLIPYIFPIPSPNAIFRFVD